MGRVWYHVVVAFGVGVEGRLVPVLERPTADAQEAVRVSQAVAHRYAGAVAFSRWMDMTTGREGPAVIRGRYGEVPAGIFRLSRSESSKRSAGGLFRSNGTAPRASSRVSSARLRLAEPA